MRRFLASARSVPKSRSLTTSQGRAVRHAHRNGRTLTLHLRDFVDDLEGGENLAVLMTEPIGAARLARAMRSDPIGAARLARAMRSRRFVISVTSRLRPANRPMDLIDVVAAAALFAIAMRLLHHGLSRALDRAISRGAILPIWVVRLDSYVILACPWFDDEARAGAWYNVGIGYVLLGRFDRALAAFDRALRSKTSRSKNWPIIGAGARRACALPHRARPVA